MSVATLVFVAVALAVFVCFACLAHVALKLLRLVLRLGPQSAVDVPISVVFTVVFLFGLLEATNHRSPLSGVSLLALPVLLPGLLLLGVGLFEAANPVGERRSASIVLAQVGAVRH